MRLTWTQPEDLVAHELVQAAADGADVSGVAARWQAAGGPVEPSAGGTSDVPELTGLRPLARDLLDELDALARPATADEPDALDEIMTGCRAGPDLPVRPPFDRVHGAWLGRADGCLLGKPVEKIPRAGIREIAEATGNWPIRSYFTERGLPADVAGRWPWNRRSRATSLVENIDGMPEDDDLNFTMLALDLVAEHGADLTTEQVAEAWLLNLPAGRVFTAERVAYRNLLDAVPPGEAAAVRNPFREWIGAQIRTDAYGWTHPGDPVAAARLAYRDAWLSHRRNGVYGAMWVAAMSAAAVVADDVDTVLAAGRAVLPPGSRLAAAVRFGTELRREPLDSALDALHERYGGLHWVHVLNNAALIAYALASTGGAFADAIAVAVAGGWDADSDGATVGAICGALAGASALPEAWTAPLRNRIASSLPGHDAARIDELAQRTLAVSND